MCGNMDNILKIKRQQKVLWPEFSWETLKGKPYSRCFQMFAPDISRLGYDDRGRVWSIICPQQGVVFPSSVTLNVEVTVTGQRGWANETNREFAADMTVVGKIWFSPSASQTSLVASMWNLFKTRTLPFPSDKAHAIEVTTHKVGFPDEPIFSLRKGESTEFTAPDFARHPKEAWAVGNLSVQIGPIESTGYDAVDTFNQKVLDIFNRSSGNMLQLDNVLTWNVWFAPPALVITEEWRTHAEKWRKCINVDHGATCQSNPAKLANGDLFKPAESDAMGLTDLAALVYQLWGS